MLIVIRRPRVGAAVTGQVGLKSTGAPGALVSVACQTVVKPPPVSWASTRVTKPLPLVSRMTAPVEKTGTLKPRVIVWVPPLSTAGSQAVGFSP